VLSQAVQIPAGTVVECIAYGKVSNSQALTGFDIAVGGKSCGGANVYGSSPSWFRFGGGYHLTLTKDATEVRVSLSNEATNGVVKTFGVSNIVVQIVSGPGSVPCESAAARSSVIVAITSVAADQ
jgi:hypothetical protein